MKNDFEEAKDVLGETKNVSGETKSGRSGMKAVSGEPKIVLVDYKTDRVDRLETLAERYHVQLEAYAEALTRATGREVSEKIIWSFARGKALFLP